MDRYDRQTDRQITIGRKIERWTIVRCSKISFRERKKNIKQTKHK